MIYANVLKESGHRAHMLDTIQVCNLLLTSTRLTRNETKCRKKLQQQQQQRHFYLRKIYPSNDCWPDKVHAKCSWFSHCLFETLSEKMRAFTHVKQFIQVGINVVLLCNQVNFTTSKIKNQLKQFLFKHIICSDPTWSHDFDELFLDGHNASMDFQKCIHLSNINQNLP